jgi:flagellar biosynthesis/type III secretory pathway chaperone
MTETTRSDATSSPWESALLAAPDAAERLSAILGLEFEALKVRDLAAFEAVQEEKNLLLQNLAQLAEWAAPQ